MKNHSLESHVRKLALKWTLSGVLLTLALSGGIFHWLTYQAAENQLETITKTTLSSYRNDILSGAIRSIELQLKKDFSIDQNERLYFLDANKSPWVGDLRQIELRSCKAKSGVCRDFWNGKITFEKPIYFDSNDSQIWGYLHIEKNPHTDWPLVISVTLAIVMGMLFQNLGFYFNLHKAIQVVSGTIRSWATKLSDNPKDTSNYESAPFQEIEPIENALVGLKQEIDSLENVARQQGALTTLRGVGHDILNPVSRMKRILGLLQMRSVDEQSRELFASLNANLKRLSSYAEQLKYIYKKQVGEKLENIPVTDLGVEVSLLAEELQFDSEAQEKQIRVTAQTNSQCTVRIPPPAFGRIIENLCGNSIQASEKNSIVRMNVEPIGDCVRVTISDDGCGIADENSSKIFEAGFTTKINKGTGLGLFVVKQICDQYAGKIRFDSRQGRGTIIQIDFPKAEVPRGVQTAFS